MRLTSSSRRSALPVDVARAWAVVASGEPGPQWYVDAAPLVFRAAIDRLALGSGADAPPPGRPLRAGDKAGFWRVLESDGAPTARLELEAEVRAPGRVTLEVRLEAAGAGCSLATTVRLEPHGLLGVAYLVSDLAAREVVVELVHRRLVRDVRRSTS